MHTQLLPRLHLLSTSSLFTKSELMWKFSLTLLEFAQHFDAVEKEQGS